jgi:anti-anti-sigma regulatory factor
MDGGLSFKVEWERATAILRVAGTLDAFTAHDLRAALLSRVAEQPPALVIDAADLRLGDEVGLTVLAGVAQEARRWPGTRFSLAGAPELVDAAGRMGLSLHLAVCPDRESAVAALAHLPIPPRVTSKIAPDRDAPGRARAAVVAFCADQGVGGDGDAAQLVASELVTNAVVHAGTEIDLTLRLLTPYLHIAVRDRGTGQPRIAGVVGESAESGRGLLLVDALASSWGTLFPDVGKIVWAQVRVRPTGIAREHPL